MEVYETISMTGAGLKDENLEHFFKILSQHRIDGPSSEYKIGNVEADVWFSPVMVWEIKTADLTYSPVYTAAINESKENKGISLRFPRFIREKIEKKPTECTTSQEVYKMYKNQAFLNKELNLQEEEFYD